VEAPTNAVSCDSLYGMYVRWTYERRVPPETSRGCAANVDGDGGFPEGIVYNATSGEISGTPIEVGIYPVTLTATIAANETLTLSFDFVVLPPKGGDVMP